MLFVSDFFYCEIIVIVRSLSLKSVVLCSVMYFKDVCIYIHTFIQTGVSILKVVCFKSLLEISNIYHIASFSLYKIYVT